VFTAAGLSSTASIGFKTTTVAVAFVQLTGVCSCYTIDK
jgi:hypothetical protein